jgi:hypothetical protein
MTDTHIKVLQQSLFCLFSDWRFAIAKEMNGRVCEAHAPHKLFHSSLEWAMREVCDTLYLYLMLKLEVGIGNHIEETD